MEARLLSDATPTPVEAYPVPRKLIKTEAGWTIMFQVGWEIGSIVGINKSKRGPFVHLQPLSKPTGILNPYGNKSMEARRRTTVLMLEGVVNCAVTKFEETLCTSTAFKQANRDFESVW